MFESTSELLQYDKKHVWHPYTSIEKPLPVYPVKSANGSTITLCDGTTLIDGMSSWWAAIHGYNNKHINEVLKKQVDELAHVMFGGFTHAPAVELSRTLVEISPEGLNRVFLCDSGSVAVEVAMKMAIQYFYSIGMGNKKQFATIRSGYHGDTFHAMAVCDPDAGMHKIYKGILPKYHFCDTPVSKFGEQWDESDLNSIKKTIEEHHQTICAVILEPIVQGAGGMRFYHPQFLKEVRKLCDYYDVLLIADEIATGLGRTGRLFGCEHAGISPDIMCLGKTLTGGYMTLAATLCTKKIGEGISRGEPGVFMHGPTYMGNPLACKVAQTSISLLLDSDWQKSIKRIEKQLQDQLKPCLEYNWVNDVRVLGAIGVVEVNRNVDLGRIQKAFVEKGVWIRPFGKLIYIMPPYIIKDDELESLTSSIVTVLKEENEW